MASNHLANSIEAAVVNAIAHVANSPAGRAAGEKEWCEAVVEGVGDYLEGVRMRLQELTKETNDD